MDPKSGSKTNNGVKNHDDLAKLSPKSKTNDAKSASKQTPASNSADPKQRVIKQIVSLDAKKLKALGIESNILSALTKFNGKDKASIKIKSAVTVKNVEPSTQTIESTTQKPTISAAISPVKPTIALTGTSLQKQSDETSPSKKIQVLSNVLLYDNKLDLNSFPVIASSSAPVSSRHISYGLTVPRPSQVKRIDIDKVPLSQVGSSIAVHRKSIESPNVEVKTVSSPVKHPLKSPSPVKRPPKSPVKPPDSETRPQTSEVETLKGFSLPELKCSQDQFVHFQNEVIPSTSIISTIKVEQYNDTENFDELPKIESTNESSAELSNTFTTTSETISSVECSDSESDLDELIVEAQLTIQNERKIDDPDNTEVSPELKITHKKPRLVQKNLLVKLTEQVDNDRLIRDFLDSTINSFNRTGCDSPSDSDSSSDERVQIDEFENDCEKSEQIKVENNVEAFDGNISITDVPYEDFGMREGIHKDSLNKSDDKDTSPTELDNENISVKDSVKYEAIGVIKSPAVESRKRKTTTKSEINPKRKKLKSINEDIIDSAPVQTQETTTKAVNESKMIETPLKVIKGKKEKNDLCFISEFIIEFIFQRNQTLSCILKRRVNQRWQNGEESQSKPF